VETTTQTETIEETEGRALRDFDDPVTLCARKTFGIEYIFPWQRLVIANIMDAVAANLALAKLANGTNRNDTPRVPGEAGDELHDEDGTLRGRQIVLLPTGSGKSLCFQIPALLLEKPTLVVFPLLALQGDQLRRLNDGGIEPAFFRGGQSREEREAQFALLEGRDGKLPAKLIIANPEILTATESVLSRIASRGISHLAIDEAHCVSEWGDSFRPSYLELGKIIERLDPPAVTAFTATASPPVLKRVAEVLYGGAAHLVRGESDRPNIEYSTYRCRAKDAALIRVASRNERPMVVFCATRGGTERAARLLREAFNDTDIKFYHAGLQKDEKLAVESWFHGHPRAILCCTCAWGMGVDKKNIRTVIHRDSPPTAESYIQEAGRGGRDGNTAKAILLWSPDDRRRLLRQAGDKSRASALIRFAESGRCRREVLLEALGDPKAGPDAPNGERIACSGCDVCDGSAVHEERDAGIVLDCVKKNSHAFTREELAERLCKTGNGISLAASGHLEWKRTDFIGIVDSLVKEGRLREIERWLFKHKIAVGKKTCV
jgi:ATP-dependent DNA helicase RecQ